VDRAITAFFWIFTVFFVVGFLAGNSGLGQAARQAMYLLGGAFVAAIVLGFVWVIRSELWAEMTKERKNSVLFSGGLALAVGLLFEMLRK
jgi:membrane protease YdiL (CAAX protease family)